MKRRNPATASSPNPQFELTSFMDIIFIFLFVVMIGYAIKCAEERDTAEQKMTEAEEILADAEQKLAEAGEKLADVAVYEQQLQELTEGVVGSRIRIITISCTYEAGDAENREEWPRHLRVMDSDQKILAQRDFTEKTAGSTYTILREALETYIDGVKDADREELGNSYDTDKQKRTLVILSVTREDGGILTRDYDEITAIIREMESAYDDVY
ncbi:MAG: hypothetical protein J6Y20_14040 [Lachnospiraceae bacterium]|nr:hypothetical protein [Lachnospiraceae bacterium]